MVILLTQIKDLEDGYASMVKNMNGEVLAAGAGDTKLDMLHRPCICMVMCHCGLQEHSFFMQLS